MRRMLLTFLLGVLLFSSAAAAQATLLYPNLRTLPPRNLRFDRTDISADSSGVLHNVLRFSNTAYNVGDGPVEIRATINQSLNPPSGAAYQRVYDSGGGFTDIPLTGSTLYYHAVHKHYHFDDWGGYELWTKAAYDNWVATGVGQPDLVGTKTTSCVEDEEFVKNLLNAIWPAQYPASKCMPNSQNVIAEGLSDGWGDTYDYYRFEQWIDLGANGSLADGTYVLRSVADPDNIVYESPNKADISRESQLDNAATIVFTISGGNLVDSDAPTGTVTINHVDTTTSSPNVSLNILGRDDVSGVDQFKVSNDGNGWQTVTNTSYDSVFQTLQWDLTNATYGGTSAAGTKTVSVMFHDRAGHWGPVTTDTIDYQPTPPPPPPPNSPYGQAVQSDGPLSWWRLGEASGTSAADQEGTNPGTYAGGATLGRPSLLSADTGNTAVTFNGTGARVAVANSTALQLSTNFSLEAWIKPAAIPASGSFASVMTKAESYSLQFNGPQLEFTVIQSGTRKRCKAPAGAISVGSIYHVVGTYDGSTQRLYLNGQQVASCALTGNATATTNALYVGAWTASVEFFNGVIDEPALYSNVLSASQVAAHYNAGTTASLTAPTGLSATAVSTSQINLNWTNTASGETNEVVERSTSSSFSSVTSVTLPAGTTSYSDTGLAAGTTYWYRVKAVSGSSSSPYSTAMQATTLAPTTYDGTVLNDHPTSYWRLDETGGTIAGDQTVANPGTFVGGPILGVPGLIAADPSNTAIGFNGSTSDIRVGQSGSLNFSGALTIEGWIQPSSLPASGARTAMLAKTGAYAIELNGAQLELSVFQLGARMALDAPAGVIVAGGRYYVAGTYDGATMRLYVNGTQVATRSLTGAADQTLSGLHIGSWDGASELFAGTIDEPAIWGSALSAAQIAAHYGAAKPALGTPSGLTATASSATRIDLTWNDNSSGETGQVLQRSTSASFSSPTSISLPVDAQSYPDAGLNASTTYYYRVKAITASDSSGWSNTASATTPAPAGYASAIAADNPVSWWRLDEASGTVAADQQNRNSGTYKTGTTLNAASLLTTDGDKAVAFDGVKGNVSIPHTASLDLTAGFSLEAWIKPNAIPASGTFNSVITHPEAYSLQFNGPQLEFTVIQSGTRRRCKAPAGAIVAGNAYHIVGTFDGTTQRLYVNGTQVASQATSGLASVTTYGLYLGSWNGSIEFFNGTIDEPAIYNTVLSATTVAQHYAAGTTG